MTELRVSMSEMLLEMRSYMIAGTWDYRIRQLKRDWDIYEDPVKREYIFIWKSNYRKPPKGL